MKKIAIIGASYLQNPLILKAKEMGFETHVFAWEVGDVGEKTADYFYPISIIEKEKILEKCIEIGIMGICSIASDLAMITVNYVAEAMGLPGNSMESTIKSTNKYAMRKALTNNGVPCPQYALLDELVDMENLKIDYPIIVKPTDRSGSRGITKLESKEGLNSAISLARSVSFERGVVVEEYVEGKEYSIECISYRGKHRLLAITEKFTTGNPNYIETGHFEPVCFDDVKRKEIEEIVFESLDALEIENGASHSEIIIGENGKISVVEIGARMGGDCIGSSLVELTTGIDYVRNVILIATNNEPDFEICDHKTAAGICYIFNKNDIEKYKKIKNNSPEIIIESKIEDIINRAVVDSSSRFGYYLVAGNDKNVIHDIVRDACQK